MIKNKFAGTLLGCRLAVCAACAVLLLSSCGPTYHKEKLGEAIKEICKIEYGMDVEAALEGSTLGVYYPLNGLFDNNLGIPESSWEKIGNVIMIASRIALSTDADIKFFCVITKDDRLPDMQVVIIKYVEDVRHAQYQNISVGESFNRTLISVSFTPQAEKERSIESIFNKLGLNESQRETVLDEFFRSTPASLSEIGYWRNRFYLKEITLEEFLGAQIANRIKFDYLRDKKMMQDYRFIHSEGSYVTDQSGKNNFFLVKFKVFDQALDPNDTALRKNKIKRMIAIANEVVTGYKFKKFAFLELEDQIEDVKLWVSAQDVINYKDNKTDIEQIVRTSREYFSVPSGAAEDLFKAYYGN